MQYVPASELSDTAHSLFWHIVC